MQRTIQNYQLHEIIGQGSFGTVYHATHAYNSNHYAVKLVPLSKYQCNSKLHNYTDNQLKTLTKIGASAHIIQFYELIKTQQYYYFVYEYCEGGTLLDRIQKEGKLEEEEAMEIFRELLEAFKVLNKYNIIHRDLKPENIFFSDGKVKLGDFGFCKELGQRENLTKTMLGSPIYMAPEVLKGETYNSKVDIWSLGAILYQMLYGVCPFQSRSLAMLISNIQHHLLEFPPHVDVTDETKKLIKRMLAKDYYRRMSWIELFGYLDSEEKSAVPQSLKVVHSFQPEPVNPLPQLKTNVSYSYEEKKIEEENPVEECLSSFNEEKKKLSLQKNDRNHKFYSHQYMNIIERTPNRKNSENRTTISLQKQTSTRTKSRRDKKTPEKQMNPSVSTTYMTLAPEHRGIEIKYESIIKSHDQCLLILKRTYNLLSEKKTNLVGDAYLVLSLVHEKMINIKQQVEKQQNFLDMSRMVNFQLIQIDGLLSQMRYHFQKEAFSHEQIQNLELKKLSQVLL